MIHLYLTHLKENRKDVALGALFVVACVVLQTVCLIPTSRQIIDEGVQRQDLTVIYRTGGLMALYSVLAMLCTVGSSYYSARATAGFAASLRKDCYDKVMSLPTRTLARYGTATLLTRTTADVNQMTLLLLNVLRSCLTVPAIIVSVLVLILINDPIICLILTATFALTIAFLVYYGGRSIERYDRLQQRIDRVTALVRAQISGVRAIRAYGNQALEEERMQDADAEVYTAAVQANRITSYLSPVALVLMNWVVVAIYLVGSDQLRTGMTSISELLVIFQYVSYFIAALAIVPVLMSLLPKVSVSASRIRELLQEPGDDAATAEPAQDASRNADKAPQQDGKAAGQGTAQASNENSNPGYEQAANNTSATDRHQVSAAIDASGDIVFDHVTFGYDPAAPVVSDLCLTARAGRVTAILGATGSGKTTLINLLQGLYRPDSGTIRIGGQDIAQADASALRAQMAYATQRPQVFHDTARNNITAYHQDISDERIREACRVAAFDEVLENLPEGLDTMMALDGRNLSGGQRQRLCLARTLAREAQIYLLDDAFSALDMRTARLVLDHMHTYLHGRTILVVTQRIRTAMNADSIIVMEEGRIVAQGRHEELLATCPVYREIYASQTAPENS